MRRFNWVKSGQPYIWLCAAATALALIMVGGLLALLALRGLGQFWPAALWQLEYQLPGEAPQKLIGKWIQSEQLPRQRLAESGLPLPDNKSPLLTRKLLKIGGREQFGHDFVWLLDDGLSEALAHPALWALERREWGDFYGHLLAVQENGQTVAEGAKAEQQVAPRLARVRALIGRAQKLETSGDSAELAALRHELARDSLLMQRADGQTQVIALSQVVRAYQPNAMSLLQKIGFYGEKLMAFLSEAPREANTEGGIFPALFGTFLLTLLMTLMVTPLGVIAALYLHEYAKNGLLTRLIRIAVHNLAGVPSIVYGVFGLGFFVYVLGGSIDRLLFADNLPAPTFGTPGLFWAALTLALLTLPVVIVSTEEGLSRIPRSLREGALALGATQAETLLKLVLPMASPALLTGMILAVARAAGEVAPLMLVGVVKLAPALAVDGSAPYLHLERKIMHLGFHIYDLGFQSPNIEAARPLVYATALLLMLLIVLLNLSAMLLRSRLRDKYRLLEH
ncbi:phosphate ABC transporter permease [Ventosimonas gracilis]|uniref:Phosphate transport system permease protein PstA n=1 Tax=Ventosimonas gracilis TaxID=1680762 RepID=A0A139SUM6_9GAMM|nr:phosphate ABC transporter permease PstA [Ventosimonas gracilis]KXU38293.1 phosphate ABC transporter permease [Ventosimonas gracilis]